MSAAAECLHAGRFLRLVRRAGWEYVERVNVTGVAVLVPVTSEGEIVLVEQYRIPVRARMVELPAGLVGDEEGFRDEDILDAANRELDEETGYRARRMQVLAISPSSGGMTSEVVTFVLASDLSKVGEGGGSGRRGHRRACRPAGRPLGVAAPQGGGGMPDRSEDLCRLALAERDLCSRRRGQSRPGAEHCWFLMHRGCEERKSLRSRSGGFSRPSRAVA